MDWRAWNRRGTEQPFVDLNPFPNRSQRVRRPPIENSTNDATSFSLFRHFSPRHTSSSTYGLSNSTILGRIEAFVEGLIEILKVPKLRRFLITVFMISFLSVLLWTQFLSQFVQEEKAAWESLTIATGTDHTAAADLFGINIRPHFPNMIHLQDLDPSLLPGSSKHKQKHGVPPGKKRLVFVGDIHGCKQELEELLEKVHFDPETDHLIATGDIVSKGPDTAGVIDLLRAYKASCVRGNHEDRLLLVADQLKATSLKSDSNHRQGTDLVHDSVDADSPEKRLAKSLNSEQLAYLRNCPVILRVGEMKAFGGEVVVVHAGLVPGIDLLAQDPASVMNMRTVDLKTHVPSKDHHREGSVPWFDLWNKYQQLLPAKHHLSTLRGTGSWSAPVTHTTIVYGHDAKKGLQINTYTKGLDTGCVKGGKLTALVAGDNGKQHVVQVKCKTFRTAEAESP